MTLTRDFDERGGVEGRGELVDERLESEGDRRHLCSQGSFTTKERRKREDGRNCFPLVIRTCLNVQGQMG